MLTIHHLGVSQSDRIVWLCEELGLTYELKRYDRDPTTRLAPAAYKALHPMGTAPVIQDGDLTLSETGAVIEYILAKYGGGRLTLGPDHPEFANYLFWFHFSNGSLLPSGMIQMVGAMLGAPSDAPVMQALAGRGDKGFALAEERLGQALYFAGAEFTAADIIMLFPLTTMRLFAPRDLTPYPNIRAYLKRIGERPAYQRAVAKADPDLPSVLG
jgi:glutathione S-transferase